jgi:hypothetical protein
MAMPQEIVMKTPYLKMVLFASALGAATAQAEIPRTADGKPNFNGTYDVSTLTPTERPKEFGDRFWISREEADAVIAARNLEKLEATKDSDPDRKAPPKGGDGNYEYGAGGVGGYNLEWVDAGKDAFEQDGKFRSSILYEPANGRYPKMAPGGIAKYLESRKMRKPNSGTAWWMDMEGPGPYDGPESRPNSDRCLQGFGSTGGPPMLPTLYNNYKRIVQTPTHVMILIEMVHDARVVRLNSEHPPQDVRKWMGDSIGWWEGDTLVVDTTNFRDTPGLYFASRDLHVVERFKMVDKETLLYQFTVEDPAIWTEPFSGEYVWPMTSDPVYEYACHEANYAMGNILRGARLLESEWPVQESTSGDESE